MIRWLFGDQLGPHFADDHASGDGGFLMVESQRVFGRRRYHRAKAHLMLSAMRHRAAELGDRVTYVSAPTYAEAVRGLGSPLQVIQPTSYAAVGLVQRLSKELEIERLPARGFLTSRPDFATWATTRGSKRLLMEDFYRDARRRHGILMDDGGPVGGRWNYDSENREPPPRGSTTLGVPEPPWPLEDDIDAAVRADLDRWERDGEAQFVGRDGVRLFAATRTEALAVLEHFIEHRLPHFGAHEDAILEADPWMAHSLLSVPLNLGLLDPLEVVNQAEGAYRSGSVPIAAAEGFIRQVLGWRDYVWHLYWHLGADYRELNELDARGDLPTWFADLDSGATRARCVSHALEAVSERGWVHHIPRLMVLGGYALQRGWSPQQLTDWFHRSFVDGYDWVMVPNVIGMSQHADGGMLATKPYTSGGAYLNTMSDHCGNCELNPRVRVGPDACPFTAGYWWFLERHRDRFSTNHRMARQVKGLDRLQDLEALLAQEDERGSRAP